jgi:ketosteroid isomerase-like protein
MSVEQNKAVVRRLIELTNLGDNDLWFKFVDENFADVYIFHDPSYAGFERGPEGFKKWFRHIQSTSTGTGTHTVEDMFGEEDKVATRYIYHYTDETGKSGAFWSISIMHFLGGKIADEWNVTAPLESAPTAS